MEYTKVYLSSIFILILKKDAQRHLGFLKKNSAFSNMHCPNELLNKTSLSVSPIFWNFAYFSRFSLKKMLKDFELFQSFSYRNWVYICQAVRMYVCFCEIFILFHLRNLFNEINFTYFNLSSLGMNHPFNHPSMFNLFTWE